MVKDHLAIFAFVSSVVFYGSSSMANPSPKLTAMKARNSFDDLKNCFDYHINPYTGRYVLSDIKNELYVLTQKNSSKVFITKIDLSNFKHSHKVEIQADIGLTLADMGGEFTGVNTFDFKKAPYGCGHGYSSGLGVTWGNGAKIIESYQKGLFKIVPSDSLSSVVVNLEQNMISEFDSRTSQRRSYMKIPEHIGLPLYVGLKSKKLFFVSNDGEKNQLVRYNSSLNRRDLVLSLADDMKIVQEGEKFALSQIKNDKIVVRFLPGWSNSKSQLSSFRVPDELKDQALRLLLSFTTGKAILSTSDIRLQKSLAKVWMFDGSSNHIGKVINPDAGYYFSQVIHDDKNDQFILLSNHLKTDDTGSIFVFKAKEGKVLRIQWLL